MTISKTENGRWRARPKVGRNVIASRTFDRKGDAEKWHDEQIRAFDLGKFVDPKAGREKLGSSLDRWMTARTGTVASSTLKADKALLKTVPTALRNLPLAAIGSQQWEALFVTMLQRDMARSSIVRMRAVVSSFYGWAMRQKIIATNPVKDAPVPKGTGVKKPHEVFPFTIEELRGVVASLKGNQADIALFLGLTGLRWGEMVALRVRDIAEVPRAAVRVSKSAPDGHEERATTKGGGARTVPLTAELVPIVKAWAAGKKPNDYLFTSAQGHKLIGPNWRRATEWSKHNRGRRIHDLRHTAASFWLSNNIDPKTVQTWLGHASMTLTVDLYSHWMGSDADNAAILRIDNLLGDAGGTSAKAENG
jgi:integrase